MSNLKHIKKIKLNEKDKCWSIHYTKIPGFNLIYEKLLEVVKEYLQKEEYKKEFNLFLDNNSKLHYEKTKYKPSEIELNNYLLTEKNSNKISQYNNIILNNKKKILMLFENKYFKDNKNDNVISFKEKLNLININKKKTQKILYDLLETNKTLNKKIYFLNKNKYIIRNWNLNIKKKLINNKSLINNSQTLTYKFKNNYSKSMGSIVILRNENKTEIFQNYFKSIYGNNNKITGFFWYPSGGFREWHTNAYNRYGWRLYLVWVEEENKSGFSFIHPNTKELKYIPDKRGYINMFKVGTSKNTMLWHNVRSDTNRFSIGINVDQNFIDTFFDFS